jgi:CheY-like chemotaxis protein
MEQVAKAKLQILVADPSAYLASLTSSLLRSVGIKKITEADNSRAVQIALERTRFDALIFDAALAPLDGVALTRAIRTDPHCLNRDTTIVLVFSEISKAQLLEARDAGVTEFIRKPLSAAVLDLRLKATWSNPRPFVTAPAYAGPDRRRRTAGVNGPNRRKDPQPAA